MTTNDQPADTTISRRRLLQGGALMGVAAFLAACGTKGTAASAAPSVAASTAASSGPSEAAASGAASVAPTATPVPTPAPTDAPGAINWANWTYYIDVDPKDQKKHPTLDAFMKSTGLQVKYQEVIDDNESFFGTIQPQLQAGQDTGWDIITMTDWMAARLIRLGWVQSFNLANMPNFVANLKDTYKGVGWDPDGTHHAPWQSGMTGIGFDPAKTGNITSLAAYFTPDPRWKGKTELLSEMRDTIGLTMLHLGLDPAKPDRAGCDQAVAALQAAKSAGIIRGLKGNSYAEDLKSGDAVLVMAWSGDMVQVLVDKPGIKFNVADEGGMLWTDNSMIPNGAQHKNGAEKLIDYYYIPENAALVEDYVNYICPCKGADVALKKIDPAVASNPLIFPPDATTAKLHIFGALTEADETYFNQQFAKVLGVG
jgi:spermidine/putrescine transport system substrate-binding protein